ncbi:tetratricopeptide (TPR) repeat protein [Dysgonomonas sp. PH5-45]|uniref:tetratricopeptide repeat protein n=1 Tax=unclassified Dysgonomonas TaxID=2630389 RepID=UPI0024753951|nr:MULTISPECIES: tetratricopeptide repeat protein [unclassified Dysgonomonas]MDH6355813.1 tetratricopeptide (TPR) repeat protein [Dysgonomonas sp. PH5-45]MDH6388720.1 tetratricopeptide (TPR) repeat protein [Dysgonomonas sp. PH5-37]
MQNIRSILFVTFFLLVAGTGMVFPQKQKNGKKAQTTESSPQRMILADDEKRLFNYYFYEAMNAKAIENYDSMFDYLNYCLQIDSTNANVLYEMGNIHNLLGNKNRALEFYRKAVGFDSDNAYYASAMAGLCLELQQYTEAISLYKKIIAQNPDRMDLYLYLSESYRMDGDIPKAIEALNKLEQLSGLNERISLQKFQLYSVINEKDKAYAEVQKYIDKNPTEINYLLLLGGLYVYDKRFKEAAEVYAKARKIDEDNPLLITAMANYYEQTGDKAAAEEELHTALLNPGIDADTKINIVAQYQRTLQQRKEDTEKLNLLLDTLMTQYPQEPRFNLMLGNLLLLQEKTDEARFQFQVYAESEPTNPYGWEQLLKAVPADSIDMSIRICQKAIEYVPEGSLFHIYLGDNYVAKEQYRKALDAYESGIEATEPDSDQNIYILSVFYGQIGTVYHQMGNTDSTYLYYEKSLQYNPSNMFVLNNYSYFLSVERKNLDKAEKMSAITIKANPTEPTYLDTYGWILFEQGAYPMAKIYLENAVKYSEEEGTTSAEVYEHYGDVLYKLDDKEQALKYWEKAKAKGDSESKTLDKKIETGTFVTE